MGPEDIIRIKYSVSKRVDLPNSSLPQFWVGRYVGLLVLELSNLKLSHELSSAFAGAVLE